MSNSDIVESATKSASYNIILQICMRVTTFVLNAFTLRYVQRDVLGVINVRLLLLYTTIQFLSREAFRRATLSDAKSFNFQQVVNHLWLTFPLSLVFGAFFAFVWSFLLEQPDPLVVTNYQMGVLSVVIAVVVEMTAEPLFVFCQLNSFVKLKVVIEGIALLLRCLIMAFLIPFFPNAAVMIFACGQIISSLFYTVAYYTYLHLFLGKEPASKKSLGSQIRSIKHLLPQQLPNLPFTDRSLVILTWSFLKQTLLKQLLTDGERYIMTLFSAITFAEQGIYDVINNLGSLAARFIFQPIEESGYLLFSQLVNRNLPSVKQNQSDIQLASRVLKNLLKLMTLLGLIILTFGTTFSDLALLIYGGKTLSEGLGPILLRWHCVYVLFIAINGVTESFTFAAMSKNDIERFNLKMVFLSFFFLTSAYFLTKFLGSQGFIIANCLNMSARIVHSIYYIYRFYRDTKLENPLVGMIPKATVLISLFISFLLMRTLKAFLSFTSLLQCCLFIALGGLSLGIIIVVVYLTETEFINFIVEHWKLKKEAKAINKKNS